MLITSKCPFPHDQFSFTVQKRDFKAKNDIKMNYSGKCTYWIIQLPSWDMHSWGILLVLFGKTVKREKMLSMSIPFNQFTIYTQRQDLGLRLRLAQENQNSRKLCLASSAEAELIPLFLTRNDLMLIQTWQGCSRMEWTYYNFTS